MKIVFISNLFPDTAEPYRGLDNATLLHHLARRGEVRVISPRPALPIISRLRRQPWQCRAEDEPLQPVFLPAPYIPKIGSRWNHRLFAGAIREPLRRLQKIFDFDVILCAWLYPDGCAVAEVAAEMGGPFVLIAQGSDVHAYLRNPVRQKLIVSAVNASRGVVTRSADLARRLAEAGARAGLLHPIYNGVDTAVFKPADAQAARKELGLPPDAAILLFVGNFLPVKRPALLVAAHAEVCRRLHPRPCHLVMIGGGPLAAQVRAEADALGFGDKVDLAGRKNSREVARFMQAADLLCLTSENEGVPNVILEAFASGLRVVSTNVGGISEVLDHGFLGKLVESSNPDELAGAITPLLSEPPQSSKILLHAARFSWDAATEACGRVLQTASGK
ncbi:MAG: glycosyltransferase [Verrucomicrobia bacterium]|nr:glycosyltransferase [Verrucomicrobiota bacterium]